MTFQQFAYKNVIRNKRTYAAYFLSSAFSVMIFFMYALFIFNPHIKTGLVVGVAVQAMTISEYIMYIFSFFFVLYSVSTFLKTRKREFGILIMHGMSKQQLYQLVFLENMLIGIFAIITGMVCGLLFEKLFLLLGARILGISEIPFYLSWKAVSLTSLSFLCLFAVVSIFILFTIRVNKLIDLFQAVQKPKREPKASALLSLLCTLLLFSSYFLAFTTKGGDIAIRMLPVIIMTIVGTYFFYTQMSVFILKILQKKRTIFLQKTNIVTIANLAYRLKDNARMFFLVTIVSTVSFCAIGAFSSFNVLNKEVEKSYPVAVNYISKKNNTLEEKHVQAIEDGLQQNNVSYSKMTFPIRYVKTTEGEEVLYVSFSQYQKFLKETGKTETIRPLKIGEAYLLPTTLWDEKQFTAQTYSLMGENRDSLSIKDVASHIMLPNTLLSSRGVIVSDELYEKLSPSNTETYVGWNTESFSKTNGIGATISRTGLVSSRDDKSYALAVGGTVLASQKQVFNTMFFVALLVGAVFFIASGSFLYFRLYADLEYDIRQYNTIARIGLTNQELHTIVTKQLLLLFFVPFTLAISHSLFAFKALQSLFSISIAHNMSLVLLSFLAAQIAYFLLIRTRYLKILKTMLL
ncbi:FtsX-like permease family protein [Priestia endophytica]|uniref:FtsX-like permease family protein n=1 Tax=Priestia endophytica TaxID=135735 RepID=UPI00228155EE|nr:ABC transporter permease [Priestia endophytica]MCY8231022.1 ABC transporter permease [Priestia endophytica]